MVMLGGSRPEIGFLEQEDQLVSKHVTISLMKPRTASLSASSSRPTHTAPIVAIRKVRCFSLPQTPTSW
jgi:hypothetical protein